MIHGAPVSPRLLEIVDGILIPLLSIMVVFTFWHAANIWRECRRQFLGVGGVWRCVQAIYREHKPSIAIMVIVSALLVRFANFWHHRHSTNHGLSPDLITDNATPIFLVSSAALILGVICWNRNISPIPVPNWLWIATVSSCILWAWWMAGFPSWDQLIEATRPLRP